MGRWAALLRAVNVGGRKLPMPELRALCGELGWTEVASYIQSGNLVFSASGERESLESALEQAIAERFRMDVPVIVRSAAEWRSLAAANPFPGPARDEPGRLMLLVSKRAPAGGSADALQAKAASGEHVSLAGGALWIHFPEGAGKSKLTPSLIDRALGSAATARNFRTVLKIAEML
ncbi:DUF1697 domain-containing protein [Allosphingosinicella sp.]|jgi:uncharacterized protein (DUF1697 family)|uniref:DUF1697 domain-containing protein n=1 Tax=Allosphingosinicella sp. TaxID=2823234 RepID=UPI002F149CFB